MPILPRKVRYTVREIGDNSINRLTGGRVGDENLVRLLERDAEQVAGSFLETQARVESVEAGLSTVADAVDEVADTVDEMADPVIVVRGLDLTAMAGTNYLLATLTGGTALIGGLWVAASSVTGAGVDPEVAILHGASGDAGPAHEIRGFTRTPVNRNAFRFPAVGGERLLLAGDTLSLRVVTASTRSAFLVDAYLLLAEVPDA